MTYGIGQIVFSGSGRFCRMAAAGVALLALGACGTASMESAAPKTAAAGSQVQGPTDTGTFPNLNIPPKSAAAQFTDTEKTAKLAELSADQAAAQAPAAATSPAAADSAELNSLAANHAKDTLQQIEGKCDPALDPTCK